MFNLSLPDPVRSKVLKRHVGHSCVLLISRTRGGDWIGFVQQPNHARHGLSSINGTNWFCDGPDNGEDRTAVSRSTYGELDVVEVESIGCLDRRRISSVTVVHGSEQLLGQERDLCEQLFEQGFRIVHLRCYGIGDNIVIINGSSQVHLFLKQRYVSLCFLEDGFDGVPRRLLAEAGLVLIILFQSVGERVRKIHDFMMESAVIHSSVGGSDVDVDPSMWFSTLKLLQCPCKSKLHVEVGSIMKIEYFRV
ncbi:hypothetical protein Tco_1294473 [Tanacetum coccineum]